MSQVSHGVSCEEKMRQICLSDDWETVKVFVGQRMEPMARKLENADLQERETQFLRGRIKELRWVATLDETFRAPGNRQT